MKLSESIKKLFKKQKSAEPSLKEEIEETSNSSSLEKFCSDNPDSAECRIYDV